MITKLLWALAYTIVSGAIVAIVVVVVSVADYKLSADDQREYNFLSNTLRDLEAPTAANALLREIECSEWPKKAERYLKIPRGDAAEKVRRYMGYCRAATGTAPLAPGDGGAKIRR